MKKRVILGLSVCLLLSFTSSAFAASSTSAHTQTHQTYVHVKKKAASATVSPKKMVHPSSTAKKATAGGKKSNKEKATAKKMAKASHVK